VGFVWHRLEGDQTVLQPEVECRQSNRQLGSKTRTDDSGIQTLRVYQQVSCKRLLQELEVMVVSDFDGNVFGGSSLRW